MEKAGKPLRPSDIAKMTELESKEVSRIIKIPQEEGESNLPKTMLLFAGEINIL